MWEYRIYKTDLWWSIYKRKQSWKILLVSYLNWHNTRTPHKTYAKIFYNKEDAISALVIMRKKDGREKSD